MDCNEMLVLKSYITLYYYICWTLNYKHVSKISILDNMAPVTDSSETFLMCFVCMVRDVLLLSVTMLLWYVFTTYEIRSSCVFLCAWFVPMIDEWSSWQTTHLLHKPSSACNSSSPPAHFSPLPLRHNSHSEHGIYGGIYCNTQRGI